MSRSSSRLFSHLSVFSVVVTIKFDTSCRSCCAVVASIFRNILSTFVIMVISLKQESVLYFI